MAQTKPMKDEWYESIRLYNRMAFNHRMIVGILSVIGIAALCLFIWAIQT